MRKNSMNLWYFWVYLNLNWIENNGDITISLLINILMISRIHTLKFLVICLLPFIALGYEQLDTKKEYLAYL